MLGVVLTPALLFAASEVVIGYANISARVSPLWIAQEKGVFTKFGVNVQQVYMSVLMDEAPIAWLYQYQGLQGVSNKFDFKANPGEDVYGWDLKPRLR